MFCFDHLHRQVERYVITYNQDNHNWTNLVNDLRMAGFRSNLVNYWTLCSIKLIRNEVTIILIVFIITSVKRAPHCT